MGKTYKKIIKNKYDKKKLNKLKHKGDHYYEKAKETSWANDREEEETKSKTKKRSSVKKPFEENV
jgi:hypothetical protein